MTHASIAPTDLTLGLLAGGGATRLGGLDKAWLVRAGEPQVLRLARRFAPEAGRVLVSANRDLARYRSSGLDAVADRVHGIGPLAGLDALAAACATSWLLTVPVDVVAVNDCLLPSLRSAGASGAWVEDDDGPQPLVALWPVSRLREGVARAIADGEPAVHRLQAALGMPCVRLNGVRFGNLNTPADLRAAGVALP